MDWYKISLETRIAQKSQYIKPNEIIRRLLLLEWRKTRDDGDHASLYPPFEMGRSSGLTISRNNWEKNWRQVRRDLIQNYPDMRFVWDSKFEIPENFNPLTCAIEEEIQPQIKSETMTFYQLAPQSEKYKVLVDGVWKQILDVDYASREIMFDDLSIKEFRPKEEVEVMKIKEPALEEVAFNLKRYKLSQQINLRIIKEAKLAQELYQKLFNWADYFVRYPDAQTKAEYDKLKIELDKVGRNYFGLKKIIDKTEGLELPPIGATEDFDQMVMSMGKGLHSLLKKHEIENFPQLKEAVKNLEIDWEILYADLKGFREKYSLR